MKLSVMVEMDCYDDALLAEVEAFRDAIASASARFGFVHEVSSVRATIDLAKSGNVRPDSIASKQAEIRELGARLRKANPK